MDEKDVEILKLKGQLDYLKTFVMTDDGTFMFPDGEFIWGCGVREKNEIRLRQENNRLQDELNKTTRQCYTVESNWKKAYDKLVEENEQLRRHR